MVKLMRLLARTYSYEPLANQIVNFNPRYQIDCKTISSPVESVRHQLKSKLFRQVSRKSTNEI